ncbi:uncharacterized protein LOC135496842 [Lineus longissimus]|uniref:uncharacterized protein LOC135496842 n=1 Tax=Lineus longissimus TaxID=88925 RepID=UPI00315C8CDF
MADENEENETMETAETVPREKTPEEIADLNRKYNKRKALIKAFDREFEGVEDILSKETPNKAEQILAEASLEELKNIFDNEYELNNDIGAELDGGEFIIEMDNIIVRRSHERRRLMRVKLFVEDFKEHAKAETKREKRDGTPSSAKTARLPKLRLPIFDGTFTKWTAFWETMEADVINGNFSDITKFSYILGQLKGPALDAVTGIHATGDNLETLTTTLKERFGQQRKIVRAHVCSIFDLEPPGHSYAALSQFYNHVMGDIRSLNNLGIDTEECAAFIIPTMERKLPRQFQDKMGTSGQDGAFNLKAFLETFVKHLNNLGERFSSENREKTKPAESANRKPISAATLVSNNGTKPKSCVFCDGDHFPSNCTKGDSDRFAVVKAKRLCFNCLRPHSARNCSNRKNCNVCNRRHHSSLHNHFAQHFGATNAGEQQGGSSTTQTCAIPREKSRCPVGLSGAGLCDKSESGSVVKLESNKLDRPNGSERKTRPIDPAAVAAETAENNKIVLLETGRVTLENGDAQIKAGVLIDRGSMLSYIRKDTAVKLKLQPHGKQYLNVNGFGGHVSKRCYDMASVNVATNEGPKVMDVLITDEIVKPINQSGWKKCLNHDYIKELPLADNLGAKTGKLTIDLLIGCDSAYLFLENRIITGKRGPTIQFSNIGCFLSGPLEIIQGDSADATTAVVGQGDNESEDREAELLKTYMESITVKNDEGSDGKYDDQFLSNYLDKMQFKEGHYYAPLPWKDDYPELKTNVDACRSRLNQVTSRLRKLNLADQYMKVMQENLDKGYVSEISDAQALKESDCHFMPHFPVLRESATTPVRIVFDASCGSPSLNDCLHGGPNMTQDLVRLLMLFRTGKYAISADLARAFLSVRLLEPDRKYVRFLWYKDNDMTKEVVPYTCNTVIFGNVSSPFALAVTLHKHLTQYNTPVSLDMLAKTYVDNLLSGVGSESEALKYYHEAREIMSSAAFDLRQWATNSEKLNEKIHEDGTNAKAGPQNVLGLKWHCVRDELSVSEKRFEKDKVHTKRTVVSETSSIFDPLGLVGPMVVPAKAFANKLWVESKSWDEHLTEDQKHEWNDIRVSLQRADEMKFPRWLNLESDNQLEIIVFCDACPTTAIGCVAYGKQGNRVTLLGSKNKVVSQKNNNLTVPKLELQAMVMGAQYADYLVNTYRDTYAGVNVTLLTDSEIALYWVKSDKKLQQFVKNRVDLIRKLTKVEQWFHVRTADNIADIISRGTTLQGLGSSVWLQGPKWLEDDSITWPINPLNDHKIETVLVGSVEVENEFLPKNTRVGLTQIMDVQRYSSYTKLLKVTSLVTRAFKRGIQAKSKISADDMHAAEQLWIRSTQQEGYGDVLTYLRAEKAKKQKLPKRPPLVNQLGLFLADDGMIHCGGRVRNANVELDRKFPILLSKTSFLSTLIIRDAHQRIVHYGTGATMCELRKKFWITSMRSTVRQVVKRCVICKVVAGRPYLTPLAPELPEFRLNELTAFRASAVDFTGHIYVRNRPTNKVQKVYVALFCCLTTRAVHLEVVPDMTVESYLRAFRRFTSNCSTPKLVYSDNAKTFKGAETEIKRLLANVSGERVQNHLTRNGISFKYIPVQASWFGGVYERLIGVVKSAIKKTLGKALVDSDELNTMVKEIQQVVNNRPLTYMSSEPTELGLHAITPNHLIFGRDMDLLPHQEVENAEFDPTYDGKTALEKMAHHRCVLINHFRKRFYDEYVAVLRERHMYEVSKQNATADTIRCGDVVLVHDKDERRINWKLGKIESLNTGKDGLTRSATVRTTSGRSNRAIGKLYPLELHVGPEEVPPKAGNHVNEGTRPQRAAAKLARERIQRQSQD